MKWLLNTTQPCAAGDLSANLLEELDHLAATQPDSQAIQAFPDYQLTEEERKTPGAVTKLREHFAETDKKREEVRAQIRQKLESVQAQATAGIEAAVSIAKAMGTSESLFHATISGHHNPDADGVTERIVVSVDIAE